jgi:hypothetical protein
LTGELTFAIWIIDPVTGAYRKRRSTLS